MSSAQQIAVHHRAKQMGRHIKEGQVDLGLVVEVDLHLRKGTFGETEVAHLHCALDQTEYERLYSKKEGRTQADGQSGRRIEQLYLHLQATGWAPPSMKMLAGFIRDNRMGPIADLINKKRHALQENNMGSYLLHSSVLWDREAHFRFLLDAGIDPVSTYKPRPVTVKVYCALDEAILLGRRKFFDELLGAGGDHQCDAYQKAIGRCTEKYLSAVREKTTTEKAATISMLVELARRGADPRAISNRITKTSPIDRLIRHGMKAEADEIERGYMDYCAGQLDHATRAASGTSSGRGRL